MALKIIPKRCKGCGICAALCPKKVLQVNEVEKIEAVNEKDLSQRAATLTSPAGVSLSMHILARTFSRLQRRTMPTGRTAISFQGGA